MLSLGKCLTLLVAVSILNNYNPLLPRILLINPRKIAITAMAGLISIGLQHDVEAKVSHARPGTHVWQLPEAKNVDGFAPVKITIKNNYGYLVDFQQQFPQDAVLPDDCCLVSIDGHSLLNRSWPEVKLLLAGPVGSTVVLELVTANGEITKMSLARTLNYTQNDCKITPLQFSEKLKAIDLRTCADWDSGEIGQNLDIFARASSRQAVERALIVPTIPDDSNLVVATALSAMIDMQEMGELASADRYLKIILHDRAKKSKRTFEDDALMLAISNLNYSGRELEALQLALMYLDTQGWHGESPIDSWDSYYRVNFLRNVVQIDSALKNSKVQALAKQIQIQYRSTPAHLVWLGDFFERSNQPAVAETIYSTQSACWLKKIEHSPSLELEDLQATTEAAYCRARLATKTGNYKSAATLLESALKLLRAHTSEAQQQRLNNLPLYFPKPREISLALDRAQKHQILLDVPTLAVEKTARDIFTTVDLFYRALSKRDFKEAQQASSSLLQRYLAQPQAVAANQGWRAYDQRHRLRARQNLYIINLSIARKLADLGKFQLSNNVIHTLQRSLRRKQSEPDSIKAQELFLNAELVFNQAQQKNQGHVLRAKSAAEPLLWRLPLRLLAMSYHYAGEQSRAQHFIDLALVQAERRGEKRGDKERDKRNSGAGISGPTGEASLLNLDAACICASNQNYSNAQKYFEKIMKQFQAPSEEQVATAVELAYIYKHQNKVEKALGVVEKLEARIKSPSDPEVLKKAYLLLAEIYFEKHYWKEALAAATRATKCKTLRSIEPYYIAGKSAEKLGDFATAAWNYFDAPRYGAESGLPVFNPDTSVFFSEAAFSAKGIPISDKQPELIATYLKAAEEYSTDSYSALGLYERALSLMGEDDAARPSLLVRICNLKYTMDSSAKVLKENILLSRLAAESASRKNFPDASKYWLTLACYEAQSGLVEVATEHGRLAISRFDKTDPAFLHIQQILPPFGLTYLLKKHGGRAQAEQLLQEAVERVNSIAGEGSLEAQAQLASQFEYYLQDKNFAKADEVLRTILGGSCSQQHLAESKSFEPDYIRDPQNYLPGNPVLKSSKQVLSKICNSIVESVRSTDCSFAQEALKQILHKQEAEHLQGYQELASTWAAIARTYVRAEDTASAYDAYQMLFSQYLELHPEKRKSNFYPFEYLELLTAMHKQQERDAIEQERELGTEKYSEEQKNERAKNEATAKAKLEAKNKAVKW